MLSNSTADGFPLFERFPRLGELVPRLPLGDWPTPVTPAARFARACGLKALYLKREDLSHPQCGGNKVRGLEFLLAEAQRHGAQRLVTIGAAGSHHVCRTAWHARRLGMTTEAIVVHQPPAEYVRRNIAAALAAGTRYLPATYATIGPKLAVRIILAKIAPLLSAARSHPNSAGPRTVYVPSGGTSPPACLGHVNAVLELKRQIESGELPEPDYLYCALGSLGTMAGLAAGCRIVGLRTRLVGVVVSFRWYCTAGRWARLANRTLRLMRSLDLCVPEVRVGAGELTAVGSALGPGYGRATQASQSVAQRFQEYEGLRLDRTYTAKAMDGALQFIRANRLEDRIHLLWYTFHEMPAAEGFDAATLPRFLRRYEQKAECKM